MTWVQPKDIPGHDRCPKPIPYEAADGSIWSCDDCGRLWRLVKTEHVVGTRIRTSWVELAT